MAHPAKKPTAAKQRKSKLNSAVTNCTKLFPGGVSENSATVRLVRDNIAAVLSDLGGASECSKITQSLARRAAFLDVVAIQMEAKYIDTKEMDVSLYVTTVNALNRVGNTLGLARRPRDVTPTLEAYLASRPATSPQKPDEDEGDEGSGDG